MHRSTPTPTRVRFEAWPCMHPHAAGMDIGARTIVVAVPPARDAEPGRVCETFTPARQAWVDWLVACHSDTVARASTGVSWGPIVERREPRGLTPSLVNARVVDPLRKDRDAFPGQSAMADERERRERELNHLSRRAKTWGYTLTPAVPLPPAPAP